MNERIHHKWLHPERMSPGWKFRGIVLRDDEPEPEHEPRKESPLATRRCSYCLVKFVPIRANHKYCSPNCGKAASKARKARNRSITHPCDICGTEFVTRSGRARYCSPECRKVAVSRQDRKAYQERKKKAAA